MNSRATQVTWLVLFSIAMGFLESAVVIYLRAIYYKQGFQFPFVAMEPVLLLTELLREVATLIMLAGVAILAGHSQLQRFSFFLLAFAVWDIFYYLFLKILVDWPSSFFTWDVLFLVPIPWVGPVLSPCLISLTMILLALMIFQRDNQNPGTRINPGEWLLLISGSIIVVLSWTWDYVNERTAWVRPDAALDFFSTYVPKHYNWWIFALGEGLLLGGTFMFSRRTRGH
jgi:hypothetical protein